MVAKSSGSDNDAANVDAEETRQSSPTHRRRRRTRLASTKSTTATAPTWTNSLATPPATSAVTEEQLFAAEVAARKLAPQESYLTPRELENGARVSSTVSAEIERQQRILEMSALPPPELLMGHETIDKLTGAPVAPVKRELATDGNTGVLGGKERGAGEGLAEEGDSDARSLWISRGLLIGAAALYGTNFGCVKLLEETVPMSLAAALRFSVSVIPFVPTLMKNLNSKAGVWRAGAEVRK